MGPERRGRVIGTLPDANSVGEERTVTAKPFDIPKRLIWNAWRLVRANQGAAGADEQSLKTFECDLKNNLYRIWNRMSSGSYFLPAAREGGLDSQEEWWRTCTRDSDRLGPRGPSGREARTRTRTGTSFP